MSSQTFPPQGVGGTTTSSGGVGMGGGVSMGGGVGMGVTAAMTVKPNAQATITKVVTNNGKDIIRMDSGGGVSVGVAGPGARTQLLADKQEGPRVVVQPAYPPMSMPKHFSPSPNPTTLMTTMPQSAGGKVMTTALKVTAASPNAISATSSAVGSGINKTACYIIPATKGPQAADITKATMVTKVCVCVGKKFVFICLIFLHFLHVCFCFFFGNSMNIL